MRALRLLQCLGCAQAQHMGRMMSSRIWWLPQFVEDVVRESAMQRDSNSSSSSNTLYLPQQQARLSKLSV